LSVADLETGKIATLDNKTVTAADITNVAFYVRAMNMNEYVFISSIVAGNIETETAEN
jgi:hypothetical protein